MRRSATLRRTKPMKRKGRKPSTFARVYGSKSRVDFVKRMRCVVCYQTPSENMHIRGDGIGRKADARYIVPCCHKHHAEAHRVGITTFEDRHLLNLERLAFVTECAWQVHSQPEHISSIVARVMEDV